MPESLAKHTIAVTHEGHQGMTRTKARLREKVWWSNMANRLNSLEKPVILAS